MLPRHPAFLSPARQFAVVLLLPLLLLGCVSNMRDMLDLGEVATPQGVTAPAVRSAFVTAGFQRGWTFTDAGPGLLRGTLTNADVFSVTVEVAYSATSYRIRHLESTGLSYDGARIHFRYNRWITILSEDVQRELTRPAG